MDGKGRLPLHAAISIKTENIKVYKTLIEAYPETLRVKNKDGEKPYKFAKFINLDDSILRVLHSM
jgi:hypothetical protein